MTMQDDQFRRRVQQQIDALEGKVEAVLGSIQALKALVGSAGPGDQLTGVDPLDPRNKLSDKKLSDRGVEVCYRLFDAGKTRYAVGELMDISFSAASYRYSMWQQAGGPHRTRRPLD